ncbi:terminase TerL endonuclease subunit [Sinorhizobium sp. RAC02]|uniref:terminase large subunit n=1 Tax=Sinorhizobium sp. RAC02 TaxID=1842534 RepID=UPI000857BB36|nr:terminase TerL endonuclease subunit [Sinorhizobium sp. RAC02]AOF89798.1 phage Terminase family protein [Sinorhizobium sp. RAC02]
MDPTTAYASKVITGEIIAGRFVRAACKRHLDDLKEGHKRGLRFDIEQAGRALRFFPAMFTVTAGEKVGQPFYLLDWMTFVVGSLFGWRNADGSRRFRHAWIETGKGQAKSPLMGAIGVYMIGFCGVKRAEAYAIANDRDQAKVLFDDAVALCRAEIPGKDGETLESRGTVVIRGVGDNAWKIEVPGMEAKFLPVATGDTISGPKPIAVFGDEIHEMKTDKAIELWKAAIDKMSGDPLMILGTNTPAADQAVATNRSLFYQRVAEGVIRDDSAFSYIARVDESDDPFNDESCWIKALPALGITYPIDNVRRRVETSKHIASERLTTERLYFGKPVGSSGFWLPDEQAWRRCLGPVSTEKVKKFPCFLALDLSQKNDLTALSACWRSPDDKLTLKTWYWTTRGGLARREARDAIPYTAFEAENYLTICESVTIDYTFVAQQVAALRAEFEVDSLTVDPAYVTTFIKDAAEVGLQVWRYMGPKEPAGSGLKIVTHAQGTKIAFEDRQLCMPHSISRMTDKILKGEVLIEENKLTDVCASNVVLYADGIGNQMFDKNRSRGKIDGMVSKAMAVGASKSDTKAKRSYMSRGVRVA